MNRPEYTCPPEDTIIGPQPTVALDASAARGILGALSRVQEFFGQHASPAVHTELRAFATARGMHPVTGAGAMLDEVGLRVLPLRQTLDDAARRSPQPAARPDLQR